MSAVTSALITDKTVKFPPDRLCITLKIPPESTENLLIIYSEICVISAHSRNSGHFHHSEVFLGKCPKMAENG
jgi:hypothetical protein